MSRDAALLPRPEFSGRGLRILCLLVLVCLSGGNGCGRRSQPIQNDPGQLPQAGDNSTDAAYDAQDLARAAREPIESHEDSALRQSADRAMPASNKESATRSPDDARAGIPGAETTQSWPRERLVLFAPGGPLVIEFLVVIGGTTHEAALERLIDEVLEAADSDGDGQSTWDEVVVSREFIHGQFGNMQIHSPADRQQVLRNYDTNHNKRVDRWEIPPFLTANRGGSRALSLATSHRAHGESQSQSPVRRWLDENEDGILSAAELDLAPVRLRLRDADDDDLLYLNDFKSPEELSPTRSTGRRSWGPETARMLGSQPRWETIFYTMQQHYANDGDLTAEVFPAAPGLFERLDVDEDGRLQPHELAGLNELEPHISLEVHFGKEEDSHSYLSTLQLNSVAPHLDVLCRDEARILFQVGDTQLLLFVDDSGSRGDSKARAAQLLTTYDRDTNGYLDQEEAGGPFRTVVAPLEAMDRDEDGKVYIAEIAMFLRKQQAARLSQIHVVAREHEDVLMAALDSDTNGHLNSRELTAAADRLRALDRDGDGFLATQEIPSSILIGFVRGNSQPDDAMPVPPTATSQVQSNLPRWFLRMDENGDGDISHREFLGGQAKFGQLDANNDGFIEYREAIEASERHGMNRLVD